MKKILLFAIFFCILALGGCANTISKTDEALSHKENPAEETALQGETVNQEKSASHGEAASQEKSVNQKETANQKETPIQGETTVQGETAAQKESTENSKNSPLPSEEEDIPASDKPDPRTLDEPPGLTVSTMYDTDSVAASCIGFSWNRELSDGSVVSTIACGRHPLDTVYNWEENTLYTAFPAGSLPPSEDGALPGSILPVFYLHFGDILPDIVSVQRWPASYIGDAQTHSTDSENVAVETENDSVILLPLGDGEFVYEVYAEWNETGSACYVFNTLPQIRDEEDSLCGYPLAE